MGDSLDKGERNGVPHATTVLPTQVLSGVPDRESRLSMAPVQTVDQGQQKAGSVRLCPAVDHIPVCSIPALLHYFDEK